MKFVVVRRKQVTMKYTANALYVLHDSLEKAEMEAKRLASTHPGEHFDVYQLMPIGTATTQAVIWQTAEQVRDSEPIP